MVIGNYSLVNSVDGNLELNNNPWHKRVVTAVTAWRFGNIDPNGSLMWCFQKWYGDGCDLDWGVAVQGDDGGKRGCG